MTATIDRSVSPTENSDSQLTAWPRILCIDDDPDIHTNVELRLRAFEVEVEHAYYGMQGIVEALKSGPDLVLTDVAMPNGDGGYLVTAIRNNAATANVPIIVLSGMRDPKIKAQLLSDGADAFLQKPIHFTELIDKIGEFIKLREREYSSENTDSQ